VVGNPYIYISHHGGRRILLTAICTAPARYTVGEHAVVYGEAAIACAGGCERALRVKGSNDISISSDIGTTG